MVASAGENTAARDVHVYSKQQMLENQHSTELHSVRHTKFEHGLLSFGRKKKHITEYCSPGSLHESH